MYGIWVKFRGKDVGWMRNSGASSAFASREEAEEEARTLNSLRIVKEQGAAYEVRETSDKRVEPSGD